MRYVAHCEVATTEIAYQITSHFWASVFVFSSNNHSSLPLFDREKRGSREPENCCSCWPFPYFECKKSKFLLIWNILSHFASNLSHFVAILSHFLQISSNFVAILSHFAAIMSNFATHCHILLKFCHILLQYCDLLLHNVTFCCYFVTFCCYFVTFCCNFVTFFFTF